ncbi:MAG: DUF6573 family protein [Chloroflexota bacterium]
MDDPVFGPVIYSYSRAQAIKDGELVAVPETTSREAGYKYPVTLTRAVFEKYVKVPPGVKCQDEAGRLWDILNMMHFGRKQGSLCIFSLKVRGCHPPTITLKAICGPGDTAEPVLTICCMEED